MKNKKKKIYYKEKRTNSIIMHDKQIYWVAIYFFHPIFDIAVVISVGLVSNDMLSASSTLIGHVKISHLAYQ